MIRAIPTEISGNEEACPVADHLLARLYRSTAAEARDLCLPLPEPVRAKLALFCSARVHLRNLARVIAATCTQSALMREGRESGRVLWEDATRRQPDTRGLRSLRKGVTLAGMLSAALQPVAPEIEL